MSAAAAEAMTEPAAIARRRAFLLEPGRVTQSSVVLLSSLLVLLLGLGDLVTGVELPFTILYLLPILVAAWYVGQRFALIVSAMVTGSILMSLIHERTSPLAIAWNVVGAAILFMAASWAAVRLRSYVDHERALRRLAVDQLRHAERLNVIGTLAAGVAHELGTPLNVIAGCAEVLAEDTDDIEVHRRTTMILEQVTKVSAIIRHLLDFGHRGAVTRTRIDLNEIAAAASEMLQSTARKRGSSIELQLGPPMHVNGNAAELEQVISNLLLNALQAMERGDVDVQTRVERRAGQPVACVVVEDHGGGIPADDLARIFDPFFTTKGVGEGTGLGLSVSYGIVRDHEGSIEVSSVPTRGSRFTVVLPLSP